MLIDPDVYNDAKYATDVDIAVLFSSLKSDLELQLYSIYSMTEVDLQVLDEFMVYFKMTVLNQQTLPSYVNQLSAWLRSMLKFPTNANATLIAEVNGLLDQFMAIDTNLKNGTAIVITPEQQTSSATYFANHPDKTPSEPFAIVLKRPQPTEPWGKFSEIVIRSNPPMVVRVPFGAIVSIDRNKQMYRYIVPNMPTHSQVHIWPDNVKQTFAFGTRVVYTPDVETRFALTPVAANAEPLQALTDSVLKTSYYGKVVVLPLTLQSVEVILPENLDTTIRLYDTTTEIRAVATTSTVYPGKITVQLNESTQTFQLLNPTDVAVLSYVGEVLFVSNAIMPVLAQMLPELVDDANAALAQRVPTPMTALPEAPTDTLVAPITVADYPALGLKVAERMVSIERAANTIEKDSSIVYAQVLYAQASEVQTTVLRLLNFGDTIASITGMIQTLRDDMANLVALTNVDWLTAEQYDTLYIMAAENQALVSQALAMAYSVLIINAVIKPQIIALWNNWIINQNNDAFEALKTMRLAARNELLTYGVVFSEANTTPTAQLIDAIVLLKTKPASPATPKKEIDENMSPGAIVGIVLGALLVLVVLIWFLYVFFWSGQKMY